MTTTNNIFDKETEYLLFRILNARNNLKKTVVISKTLNQ